MEFLSAFSIMLAHTLIGFYFVFFGFWNIYHWRPLMQTMAERNIPHPWLILSIGIAWQVVCGFFIILNVLVKPAALLLIPFTLFAIFIFYPFWKYKGEHRALILTLFTTHITVTLGALLLL